jgi:hypothetical protein
MPGILPGARNLKIWGEKSASRLPVEKTMFPNLKLESVKCSLTAVNYHQPLRPGCKHMVTDGAGVVFISTAQS